MRRIKKFTQKSSEYVESDQFYNRFTESSQDVVDLSSYDEKKQKRGESNRILIYLKGSEEMSFKNIKKMRFFSQSEQIVKIGEPVRIGRATLQEQDYNMIKLRVDLSSMSDIPKILSRFYFHLSSIIKMGVEEVNIYVIINEKKPISFSFSNELQSFSNRDNNQIDIMVHFEINSE